MLGLYRFMEEMVMVVRIRVLAAASALALIGSLAVMVSQAAGQSPGAGVTFTSQRASLDLIAHYAHSPTQAQSSASSVATAEQSHHVRLSAKSHAQAVARSQSNAASSNNTNSDEGGDGSGQTASFIGQQASKMTCSYFAKGCNPPDMAIAASTQFVLQGVNTQFEVLDPSGNVQPGWPVSAQNFFGVPFQTGKGNKPCDTAHGSQPFLSDPRALYDPADGRFWAALIQLEDVPGLGIAPDCPFKSIYWVAVSQTSNPSGLWNVFAFNTSLDGVFVNDYTQIGLNSQAMFGSLNMFNIDANGNILGAYAEVFEANKAQMENGSAHFKADAFFNLQAAGPGTTAKTGPFFADTVQPAMNLDASGGTSESFVDTLDGPDPVNGHGCTSAADSCSGLALWTMTNPTAHDSGGAAPTFSAKYVATKPFVFPPAQNQPSCSHCVDGNDLRTPGTPMLRNGVIYTAWDTALNNGTAVVDATEWAQVTPASASATTGYYNFSGDASASYPALLPDSEGNVLMVFEHMSSTVFPETRYIIKSADDDNFHGSGVLLKAGEGSYRPSLCGSLQPDGSHFVCRWGDFEAASWDGDGHIWFAGEYANTLNPNAPQFGRNWGTWIGAINAS